MTKPATSLVITRSPIVDGEKRPTRDLIKWFQDMDKKVNASLTLLGIDPSTVIGDNPGTIGSQLQHIDANGHLTPPGIGFTIPNIPGAVQPPQVGFNLDDVQDGTTRFAVAQVDPSHLAIINFADAAHQNKTLDNVNDGTTYQRFTRVASGQIALNTGVVLAGTALTTTVANASVLSTDTVVWCLAGAPAAGYAVTNNLFLLAYVTAGNVNFYAGNSNAVTPITAGAQSVNYLVIR